MATDYDKLVQRIDEAVNNLNINPQFIYGGITEQTINTRLSQHKSKDSTYVSIASQKR